MLRNYLVAAFMAVLSGAVRLDRWAGEQFLKCIDQIPEFGLDWKVEAAAMRMAGTADRGQLGLGTILAAFTVVIAAMVVLIVVDRFDQSLDTPSSSGLSQAEGDILSGFGDMASLIGPLLLIAIGVVIIGLIRRVQG